MGIFKNSLFKSSLKNSPLNVLIKFSLITVSLFVLLFADSSAKETFWVGNIRSDINYYIKAKLDINDSKFSGTISILRYDLTFPVQGEINDQNKMSFQLNVFGLDDMIFNAALSDDKIEGNVKSLIAQGKFWMRKYDGNINTDSLTSLIGWYKIRDQKYILTWGGDCFLSLMNLEINKGYSLMPLNDSTFFEWSDRSNFTFQLIKRGGKLFYLGDNSSDLKKIKPQYKQDRINILNDSVSMFGTLHYKESTPVTKLPLIIFVPGPEGEQKDNFYNLQIADYFTSKGYAAFLYDKRGTGESSGSWHNASFEDLADDALKAAEYLKYDQHVDNSKIILFGYGQGGLVAPFAASKSNLISKVISCMGSATSTQEQEIFDVMSSCKKFKANKSEEESILNLYEKFFNYTQTGNGWNDYYELAKEMSSQSSYRSAGFPPLTEDDWRVQFWKANSKYDAVKFWESVTVPSLIIYGMKDSKIPTSASIANMSNFIDKGYKTNIEVNTYPNLGHFIGKEQLDYIYMWLKLNEKN